MPNLTIQGTFTGSGPTINVNTTISVPAPVAGVQLIALLSGLNTITIPTGTKIVTVQLPAGNTQTVTLKGVTGDTGILMLKDGGYISFTPDSSVTSFALTTGGAISALTVITFI